MSSGHQSGVLRVRSVSSSDSQVRLVGCTCWRNCELLFSMQHREACYLYNDTSRMWVSKGVFELRVMSFIIMRSKFSYFLWLLLDYIRWVNWGVGHVSLPSLLFFPIIKESRSVRKLYFCEPEWGAFTCKQHLNKEIIVTLTKDYR